MRSSTISRIKGLVLPGIAVASLMVPFSALAAVYGGGGILEGITAAAGLGGISDITNIRELIVRIIIFILDITLLLAVVAIIVAGIYLIVSNGDEGQKDKAKRIILYAIVGIILILMSRVIVSFINQLFS